MKPVIFYVDDEPHNLTVFEASLPDDWEVKTFDSAVKALEAYDTIKPWVVVSDQRMPTMSGVQYLELTKKLCPDAIRILVTGYSDENLVVESVRKAQVFDYIRKPWNVDDMISSIGRAVEMYKANIATSTFREQLKTKDNDLKEQIQKNANLTVELDKVKVKELELRKELACWVPPFVLWALKEGKIKFPVKKDLVIIAFDIVRSSELHDVLVSKRSLRSLIIQTFSEHIIRFGGWRESHSGDSAYGHFGLFEDSTNPAEAALAVAREFRVALRGFNQVHGAHVECGLAIHFAKSCVVDVHTVQMNTPNGVVTQKSFDTTSPDIDLLFRMEKFTHQLPGSNIIMSDKFVEQLTGQPKDLVDLGAHILKGQRSAVALKLLKSDLVSEQDIQKIKLQTSSFIGGGTKVA